MRSMTGFGRGESLAGSYSFKVEVKTVNHRYNDIAIKMPRYLSFLEENIKKEVKKDISRGRVDIYINLEYIDDSSLKIDVDLPLARESFKALELLTEDLNIDKDITISNIMEISDVIKIERQIIDEEELWETLKLALDQAIKDAVDMKEIEGENLKKDMFNKLEIIESLVEEIETRGPLFVLEYKEKLESRIKEIMDDSFEVDQEKLAWELALFADKSNIDEEITRLKSHINQFYEIAEEKGPVGRKLDFLIQEINREINTIGSKSGDIEITNNVVELKAEVEKIREQVQNIE